jgi:small nuclear ribonucleoprotein (snRNP)-like protein
MRRFSRNDFFEGRRFKNNKLPSIQVLDQRMETPSLSEQTQSSSAIERFREIAMESTMRIFVTDGRMIEGEFNCIDSGLNFILDNATEYYCGGRNITEEGI